MDPSLFAALSACLGLALGSFATVLVSRFKREDRGPFSPLRSACPQCDRSLPWFENLPLLSFAVLGGRCRGCHSTISWSYPAMELVMGLWGLGLALAYGPGWPWAVYLGFGLLFTVLSFIDFEHYLLPDVYTLPGAAAALACAAAFLNPGSGLDRVMPSLWGGLVGGGGFWLLHAGYRRLRRTEGLGLGDVKLMLLIGLLLGVRALPFVLLTGSAAALLASLWYLSRPSSDGAATRIPYGPFLCLGAMLWILAGEPAWAWYLSLYA